jgi:hypothetical protein
MKADWLFTLENLSTQASPTEEHAAEQLCPPLPHFQAKPPAAHVRSKRMKKNTNASRVVLPRLAGASLAARV